MKIFLALLVYLMSSSAYSTELTQESFIDAWQTSQVKGKFIESLKKKSADTFKVKFSNLPYEGELKILSVGIEKMDYGDEKISAYGFMEVDLVDISSDFIQKYETTFYKWKKSNMMYYSDATNSWITSQAYSDYLKNQPQPNENLVWSIISYWEYIFILILFYFVFSQFTNNRKINQSIEYQQQALRHQIEAIEQATTLHKKTNEHLKELIDEIRKS